MMDIVSYYNLEALRYALALPPDARMWGTRTPTGISFDPLNVRMPDGSLVIYRSKREAMAS